MKEVSDLCDQKLNAHCSESEELKSVEPLFLRAAGSSESDDSESDST